jgi:VanZ family protein
MKKKLLQSVWPPVVWTVIIFVLLIIPGSDFPEGPEIPFSDKIVHVFLFGVQVFLWCMYAGYSNTQPPLWIFLLIFLISCMYGIGMEYIQKYWVANRGFEKGDMIADIIGSVCGWLSYRFLFLRTGK